MKTSLTGDPSWSDYRPGDIMLGVSSCAAWLCVSTVIINDWTTITWLHLWGGDRDGVTQDTYVKSHRMLYNTRVPRMT